MEMWDEYMYIKPRCWKKKDVWNKKNKKTTFFCKL